MRKLSVDWLALAGGITALALWWWLSRDSQNPFFPPLSALLADAWSYWLSARGLHDMGATLSNIAIGIVLGVAAGIAAGIAVGRFGALRRLASPLLELVRATPNVILLPVTMSLLGIGDAMKIANIALAVMWPVLIATQDSYQALPAQWLQTARVFGLTRRQTLVNVVVPAIAPGMLTGIKVALPLSLIVGVTTEMVGATAGIGSIILGAQYTFDVPRMWSGVILLSVVGFLLNAGFQRLRAFISSRLS
jgi:sulfonate transport system permease protein